MKKLILLTTILASCGQKETTRTYPPETPNTPVVVNPVVTESTVKEFVNQFFQDAEEAGFSFRKSLLTLHVIDHIPGDDSNLLAGQCRSFNGTDLEVYISTALSKRDARTAVYHELGHCFLGLDHVEASNHIMSEQIAYISSWDLDLRDMFDTADREYTTLLQE